MSVLARRFDDVKAGRAVTLFKSTARASQTAISGAISSMSTTWFG